jgi:hypothetical protein|tara:strand:- start:876 stop:1049 length:174 start_codon:yes stop_codon:yes gene_type:complete
VLSHTSLAVYYQTIFSMVQHHKYSINELENLYPFERDIYFEMLVDHVQKVNQEQEQQ